MMECKAFDSIIGYAEVKLELTRILDQLQYPEKYTALGVTDTHGLLLHGAPGVGKSSFAMDFLKASGRKTFICRKDKPNGDFVKYIKETFDKATAQAPSIVFMDDMDKFVVEEDSREEFVALQSAIDEVHDLVGLA